MKFLKFSVIVLSILSFVASGSTIYLSNLRENEKEKRVRLEEVRTKLETQISELESQKTELETSLSDLQTKNRDLSRQLQLEQSAKSKAASAIREKDAQINNLQQVLKETEKAFQNAQRRNRQLEETINNLQASLRDLEQKMVALQATTEPKKGDSSLTALQSAEPVKTAKPIQGSILTYIPLNDRLDAKSDKLPSSIKITDLTLSNDVQKAEMKELNVVKVDQAAVSPKQAAGGTKNPPVTDQKQAIVNSFQPSVKKVETKKVETLKVTEPKKKRSFWSSLKFWKKDENKKGESAKKAAPVSSKKVESKSVEKNKVSEIAASKAPEALSQNSSAVTAKVEKKEEKKTEIKEGIKSIPASVFSRGRSTVPLTVKSAAVSKSVGATPVTPVAPVKTERPVSGEKLATSSPKVEALNMETSKIETSKTPAATSEDGSGRVLLVNRKFNFAVTNLGSNDGLALNDIMSIQRGGKEIGKVRIEKIYDDYCAAYIIEEQSETPIGENDAVIPIK